MRPGAVRPRPASLRKGCVFRPCLTRSPPSAFSLLVGQPPCGRTARFCNLFKLGADNELRFPGEAGRIREACSVGCRLFCWAPLPPAGAGLDKTQRSDPSPGGVGREGGGHPTRVSERQPTDPTAQGAETLSKPSTSSRPTPGGCTCPQERQEETASLWWWWGGSLLQGKGAASAVPVQVPTPARALPPRPTPRRPRSSPGRLPSSPQPELHVNQLQEAVTLAVLVTVTPPARTATRGMWGMCRPVPGPPPDCRFCRGRCVVVSFLTLSPLCRWPPGSPACPARPPASPSSAPSPCAGGFLPLPPAAPGKRPPPPPWNSRIPGPP